MTDRLLILTTTGARKHHLIELIRTLDQPELKVIR